jgi:2-polyprenyl-3-methyl-5-hydroxy-6-metoxy-1,4-benzoquinol methylase
MSAIPIRAWMAFTRARARLSRSGAPSERLELVRRFARGRSFADVGCMWGVDGEVAFAAEAAGAEPVSGLDVMEPSRHFEAEHERLGSSVRFVQGDIHDAGVAAELGRHDVVWCSGLIYHASNPLLTLERLREITGELLILSSETIPEVPGLRQACVFFPALSASERVAYASARPTAQVGLTTEFDPARGYENWYWGLSVSALEAMLRASGFEPVSVQRRPLHATVVARVA